MNRLETYFELPHSVGVDFDALGRDFPTRVGVEITIRLPRRKPDSPFLRAPHFRVPIQDLDSEVPPRDLSWGFVAFHDPVDKTIGAAWVKTLGVETFCQGGREVVSANALISAMKARWPSVCDWIEVLSRQVHTVPNTLVLGAHHPVWVETDGKVVLHLLQSPAKLDIRRDEGPDAPIALSAGQLEAALLQATRGPPPTEWLLIRDGRIAHRHGSTRRAVIDAGTAVELAITELLRVRLHDVNQEVFEQLLAGHRMLGARTTLLQKLGGTLPADTRAKLVEPRNRATHLGTNPAPEESREALLIASQIVESAYPLTSFE